MPQQSQEVELKKQLTELHTLQKCIMHETKVLQEYIRQKAFSDFFFNTQSPKTDKITAALVNFAITCPALKKGTKAYNYNYQSLPDFLNDVTEPLAKCGCKIRQDIHTIPVNAAYEFKTFIVTIITHSESDQYIRSVTIIPDSIKDKQGKMISVKENNQAFGSCTTYVKRYAIKAMLGVDADKDTDGEVKWQK